jgi:hypothetical protein
MALSEPLPRAAATTADVFLRAFAFRGLHHFVAFERREASVKDRLMHEITCDAIAGGRTFDVLDNRSCELIPTR